MAGEAACPPDIIAAPAAKQGLGHYVQLKVGWGKRLLAGTSDQPAWSYRLARIAPSRINGNS
jgi:hypothetical protein